MFRIDAPTKRQEWTCEQLDNGLKNAGLLVTGASLLFANWAKGFQNHCNQLPLFDQKKSDKAGGDPNIRYYHSYYKLAKDEVLVIDANVPKAELDPHAGMWNFQLNNHWMEALDYRYDRIHTNMYLAKYRNNKSVRIFVTPSRLSKEVHAQPSSTWLTTTGHLQGTMCFRWIRPQVPDQRLPHPITRVMKYTEAVSLGAES